jgi:hypothetical protein
MYGLKPNAYAEDALNGPGQTGERTVDALLAVAFELRTANLIAHLEAGFMTPGEVAPLVDEIAMRLGVDR